MRAEIARGSVIEYRAYLQRTLVGGLLLLKAISSLPDTSDDDQTVQHAVWRCG